MVDLCVCLFERSGATSNVYSIKDKFKAMLVSSAKTIAVRDDSMDLQTPSVSI